LYSDFNIDLDEVSVASVTTGRNQLDALLAELNRKEETKSPYTGTAEVVFVSSSPTVSPFFSPSKVPSTVIPTAAPTVNFSIKVKDDQKLLKCFLF
tara:strand:- start:325 stop:612 length:288 start_codon:yes stop_codon:yes gene_type:complete